MKKFLINIAIFFAIVTVVDFSLGKVFRHIQSTAGGRTGAEYYVCEKANEDVIIMGSSRASHHYVPEIISEKLGMSCFNAGQDGNGIIMQYGRWKMLSERHLPKLLIYDIGMDFDIVSNDNMTYIDRLKPFCKHKNVTDYIASIFPLEKIKVLSPMYCFNFKFLEMVSDCIKKNDFMSEGGYFPLNGHIRREIVEMGSVNKPSKINFDRVKLHYLEQIIYEAKKDGVEVVICISPIWRGGYFTDEVVSEVNILAKKYGVSFFDYTKSEICENPDYFCDSSHLNKEGAIVFTKDLVSKL